jgi:glyoxylase-like metal-dependent hydrolase (beta-lactamase superfamily II)
VVLVDTGNGSKLGEKERDIFALPAGNPLLENLAAEGVRPEDVTLVLLSHLHMDHVGGATHREGEQVVPSFPRARFVAQRQEWDDAVANRSHMRVSYRSENLAALEASGRLELLDGDAEVVPGLSVRVTGGHTRGHHCIFLQSRGETLFFPADLCPTVAHLRGPWNMGYDMEPYVTMQVKEPLLRLAAREGWVVAFDHEPVRKVVRLQEQDGQLQPVPV